MDNKLVSVIIPTFNRKDQICTAIDSVLRQTYQCFEILIIDDYGHDDTEELIRSKYGSDSRIKYFMSEGAKGPSGARNYGMEVADGEYIAFLDSDDEWVDIHLDESISVLEKGLCPISFALWSEKDAEGNEKQMLESDDFINRIKSVVDDLNPIKVDNVYVFGKNFFEYASMNRAYCTQINTLVFKKDILTREARFNEKLMQSEDLDFILRMIMNHGFCLIMNNHFIYNTSDDSVYHFMDRSLIDVQTMVYDKKAAMKIAASCFYKIEHYKSRKRLIIESSDVVNKKQCIDRCNNIMGNKAMSLAVIIQKQNRLMAIKYCFFALLYLKNKEVFDCFIKMLIPFCADIIVPKDSGLNFY